MYNFTSRYQPIPITDPIFSFWEVRCESARWKFVMWLFSWQRYSPRTNGSLSPAWVILLSKTVVFMLFVPDMWWAGGAFGLWGNESSYLVTWLKLGAQRWRALWVWVRIMPLVKLVYRQKSSQALLGEGKGGRRCWQINLWALYIGVYIHMIIV